jgi:hypothetical protein
MVLQLTEFDYSLDTVKVQREAAWEGTLSTLGSCREPGLGIMNNTHDTIMSNTPIPITQAKTLDFHLVASKP